MGDVAVIFGTQRCGSNFFLSACRRLEDVLVLGEMYHRGGAFPFQASGPADYALKQRLAGIVQRLFPDDSKEILAEWRPDAPAEPDGNATVNLAIARFSHRWPNKYFNALRELAGGRKLLLKIFPEHLELHQILSVLREQRPEVMLLLRNPLDSFISYKKLVETKKPQDIDTSDLKIKFDKAEYFSYKAGLNTYFSAIAEFCSDEWIGLSATHYEWLHGFEPAQKPEMVRRHMERVFDAPMKVVEGADSLSLYKQQDHSTSPAHKVTNPPQLPQQPQVIRF